MLLEICARTVIVYFIALLGIRLAGKREIGQLTPFDLVVLLLISNAVQNAMTGPNTSITGGITAAITLLAVNYFVNILRIRSRSFRLFIEGVPVVLVSNGKINHANLDKEKMSPEDLEEALREHEVSDIAEVELAMLEVDGTISVIRRAGKGGVERTRKRLMHHYRSHG